MKRLAFLTAFAMAIYIAGQGFTALKVLTYRDADPMPPAQAIVVLSGPWTEPDQPKGETRQRVDRAVALWNAQLAPMIVMTGGGTRAYDGGPGDAHFMAEYAVSLGVPRAAILTEPASHSTLQNAWLTGQLADVDKGRPIHLVTHRYHLPRAVASFRWGGFLDILPVAADPTPIKTAHVLEGLKWPLNITRAALASAALAIGLEDEHVLPLLH